jgi:hypothetical protein
MVFHVAQGSEITAPDFLTGLFYWAISSTAALSYQIFAASATSALGTSSIALCGQAARHTPHPKHNLGSIVILPCAEE